MIVGIFKFEDRVSRIHFVGEAATLILHSTPTKAFPFLEDHRGKKFCLKFLQVLDLIFLFKFFS